MRPMLRLPHASSGGAPPTALTHDNPSRAKPGADSAPAGAHAGARRAQRAAHTRSSSAAVRRCTKHMSADARRSASRAHTHRGRRAARGGGGVRRGAPSGDGGAHIRARGEEGARTHDVHPSPSMQHAGPADAHRETARALPLWNKELDSPSINLWGQQLHMCEMGTSDTAEQ